MRLVVQVEGGIVQSIHTDSSECVVVIVQDWDTEGAMYDDLTECVDGSCYFGSVIEAQMDKVYVSQVFAGTKVEDDPRVTTKGSKGTGSGYTLRERYWQTITNVKNTLSKIKQGWLQVVTAKEKQQEDYVAKHGLVCPNCGSDQIESTGTVEIDGPIGFGPVECKHCKATWNDQYGIVGLDNLTLYQGDKQ